MYEPVHKPWKNKTPEERFRAISWSVATSCAIETGEDPQAIYKRLMERNEDKLPGLKEDLEVTES